MGDGLSVDQLWWASVGQLSTHLFYGEIVNEVVVVLIEAAVQGDTVRVDEQVLQSCHALQAQ